MSDAVSIAKAVIAAAGEPFSTLSLAVGMPSVTSSTTLAEGRRNYMRLAALIHPDRIGDDFDGATTAFQLLVKAFDVFANPPPAAKETKRKVVRKTAKKPAKKKKIEESDSSSQSSSSDSHEISGDSESEASQVELLIKSRTNTKNTFRTPVACPNCRTGWQPDDPKHYTLFMKFGMKTHCQLCLLQYGWATALHACPLCKKHAEYDSSQYDKTISCGNCKGTYGYNFYAVTPALVRDIRNKEKEAEAIEAKKNEREERAAARTNGDEDITMMIGTCMIEDKCPICKKDVRSKHRQHVTECSKKPPAVKPRAKQVRTFVVDDSKKKKPRAKKSLAKKSPAPKAKKKPAAKKAKRRKSADSDSD